MITTRVRHTAAILAFCLISAGLSAADLKPKTNAAFDKYVAATEQRFTRELKPGGPFLYIDELSADKKQDSYQRLKDGEILIEKREAKAEGVSSDVPDGLVHHWVALV